MRLLSKEEIDGLIEERDMLAYENKAMAEYITKLYNTYKIGSDVEAIIFEYKEKENEI